MQPVLRDNPGDYWRPPNGSATLPETVLPECLCRRCATEFAIGARFCHVCGFDRESQFDKSPHFSPLDLLDFERLRHQLGLGVASMLCLTVGVICFVVAALSSFTGQASAIAWQARTAHTIQWLLAAIAALLAGVLLKK